MNQRSILTILLFSFIVILNSSCSDRIEQGVVHEQPFDTSRLVKVQLAGDLDEPMEIAITHKGDVLIVERKGGVKLYQASSQTVKQIASLKVYSGQEDGLLGLAMDPDFRNNNFVYMYYSPVGAKPVQRVSRFLFKDDSLQLTSEKILLEIPTQREECCHSAGSLAFGKDGNLFIAVGDNTNPHNPGYYNSIDERKGRENWDAQRTAGNTNDLRGKILRIHPEPDGTYTIPEGNLFPKGTPKTKPEIFTMGCRNPYRINTDLKRGWLFWGDVGQNTIDNPKRGPISYDEFHLATRAGFFGWPYFAGPNSPYTDFDFATEKIGPFFDPQKPVNQSVNNTGLTELPPAQGALIYYSYDESKEFKHLGTGGKSPISGPVFYTDLYKENINDTTRHLHEYFNGKVFIAEWMRDWINVISVDENGKLDSIEPFMRGTAFHHPIELEIGPDGMLYLLDYGTNWFSKNSDAALHRIEYHRGEKKIQAPKSGTSANANALPEIDISVEGNQSFYWPNGSIKYSIDVKDKEDGTLKGGQIPENNVQMTVSSAAMGTDVAMVAQSHELVASAQPDFAPINNSDCRACHAMSDKSVGPSYLAIAERYDADQATIKKLANKIIQGGSGAWDETHAMSAHPQLSEEDASQMVRYILSLKDEAAMTKKIKSTGILTPDTKSAAGEYVISVTYKDKEEDGAPANVAQKMLTLRPSKFSASAYDDQQNVAKLENGEISFLQNESWILFRSMDLSGIKSVNFQIPPGHKGGKLTLRLGVAVGADVGTIVLNPNQSGMVKMDIKPRGGTHEVYLVYSGPGNLKMKSIQFNR